MKGRRLWCKVAVHGSEVRVYVTKKELLLDDGSACDAYFDTETNIIEISWCPDEAFMKMKLMHELLHVCFRAHSSDLLGKVLGTKTIDQQSNREEQIVSFLEPVLYDLLARNGWLHFPKPPKLA
jgi:hypothetical protein